MKQIIGNKESLEQFEFPDLCIFTSTKYDNDEISIVRYPLTIKTLENCEQLGIKTILVDSSSNIDYLQELKRFKGLTIIKNNDIMGKKRRMALSEGIQLQNISYFLWTEPEKYDLIKKESLNTMISELRLGNASIVVPHRNSMDQMSPFFAWIERRGIKKVQKEILKSDTEYDLWFGPKMFDRIGAEYFLNYNHQGDKKDLRDSHVKPTTDAYLDGLPVLSVDVDYTYDISEVDIEPTKDLKIKRLQQYTSILAELLKK